MVGGRYLMEGLKFGWRKPNRSNTYHYIADFSNKSGNTWSLCYKHIVDVFYAKNIEFLEKYEILDTSKICHICELKLQQIKQNNSKKETLTEINEISVSDGHVLKNVLCSQENCKNSGVAFVSIIDEEKPHYCIKHNLRVQETIRKEKELEIVQ